MTVVVEHTGFLAEAHNWAAVSTVLFGIVLYKYARKPLLDMLDARTDKIRKELDEAEHLRVEAQELLARYQRQHKDAVKESEQIIGDAQKQALEMKSLAEKELELNMERKYKQFDERIQRMEQAAIASVRDKIIDLSMQATTEVLKETLATKKSSADNLTSASIETLSDNIHKAA